jgi:SAM-dependent methyltransferase
VPAGARVLDLASGPGAIARELVKKGCSVTVVDRYPPAIPGAGIKAVAQDLNEPLQVDPAPYDCILMLDVIEHLSDPEKFLAELRQGFDHRPRKLVLTTGNIAFLTQRVMLLFGQFNYGKMGILDRTHTRLFTFRAIKQLLRDEGFRVKAVKGIPVPFPKIFGNGAVGKGALALNDLLIRVSKSLFAYQIYIEAETTPALGHVVRTTEEATARRIASANDVNV